ncbi:juvenile hormone acid O-methyltransferase-like [Dermacentor silvarum]|uniref:juvenile hormone acid O-methyltransferase-like n=1 Tax=Dermacentor silvarum TaxID=543639 RepID=UPI001899C6A9|nr:juvenile hormone acid O-methyltransferase-like [Dermacentor silvarum]
MAGVTASKMRPAPYTSLHAADLYAASNSFRYEETGDVLQAFQSAFVIQNNDNFQYLDVGCGTGQFTHDFILPSCQPCRRLVAVDASIPMLEYAKQHFPHKLIKYEHLDIEGDVSSFVEAHGPFHRVYSFKLLHWAKDLHRALANISELMIPGGECLLVFLARAFVFESFRHLSTTDPWRKYADILLSYIPASHDILDPSELRTYLDSALGSAKLVTLSAEVLLEDGAGIPRTSAIVIPHHITLLAAPAQLPAATGAHRWRRAEVKRSNVPFNIVLQLHARATSA